MNKKDIINLARNSLENYLQNENYISPPKNINPKLLSKRAGVFVGLHKGKELRGCIGTFKPSQSSIANEIIRNAVEATHDPRFLPLSPKELEEIKIKVDILSQPKKTAIENLDAKKYGILIKSKDGRKGLLLPNLEGIETPEKQIAICREKAGIRPEEKITIYRFKVKRYEEE